MSIHDRLAEVEANIQKHAHNRPVTLVAVTKYATIPQMREAYAAGVRDFGENKVQDALEKIAAFPSTQFPGLRWHFIGNLQTNKAKKTVGQFHLIHAIDSVHQAEALSKVNQAEGQRQAVLIQVNMSDDPGRHGGLPNQIGHTVEKLLGLEGIALRGLMTMAPPEASLSGDRAVLNRVFCGLAAMRDTLAAEFAIALPELSMGMTQDYVHALECGATIIRLGNYLFKNE